MKFLRRSPQRKLPPLAFEIEFDRKILIGESLRITAIIVAASLSFGSFLFIYIFFNAQYQLIFEGKLPIAVIFGFYLTLIAYELRIKSIIQWHIKKGTKVKEFLRYLNAFVETSLPTAVMLGYIYLFEPAYVLFTPIPFIYFYFIFLSALRLEFKLSLFTGAVAALEYFAIAFYAIKITNPSSLDPRLLLLIPNIQKSGILFISGIITGLVALQIKNQILDSVTSIEDKNRVLRVFGQHVSPEVVNKLLEQKHDINSELRSVCVMFLDIRNFTAFSEKREPEEVVAYLNTFFDFTIEIINRHHGIVNKFLGDGFMAVFGAPISNGNESDFAVTAALEIIARIQQEVSAGNIAPTRVGIGLHVGDAVTGTVGSSERQEYTVIGDVVNLASRIEQLNKQYGSQLLISEAVLSRLETNLEEKEISEIGEVLVKGREMPVSIYQLA